MVRTSRPNGPAGGWHARCVAPPGMESLPAPLTPRLVLVPEVLPPAVAQELDRDAPGAGDYPRSPEPLGLLVDVYG